MAESGARPAYAPDDPARPPTVDAYLRPGTLRLGEMPPLSLYVHLPWCLAKCPYCDFNSHAIADSATLPESRYLR